MTDSTPRTQIHISHIRSVCSDPPDRPARRPKKPPPTGAPNLIDSQLYRLQSNCDKRLHHRFGTDPTESMGIVDVTAPFDEHTPSIKLATTETNLSGLNFESRLRQSHSHAPSTSATRLLRTATPNVFDDTKAPGSCCDNCRSNSCREPPSMYL